MLHGRRIVVVIPAGRKPYLSILMPQLLAQGDWIDEIRLWRNSYIPEDIHYINALPTESPRVTVEAHDVAVDRLGWGWSIYPFFRNCAEHATVYIRLDDDMVWLAPGALETLVNFRIENPHYFLVYSNIINNPITSHIHQRSGAMHRNAGVAHYNPHDQTGYESADFWEAVHGQFLGRLAAASTDAYLFDRWELYYQERMQINCIAWLGEDFADFRGEVPVDEEVFLSVTRPQQIGRINCICGQSLVVHSAYWKQRIQIFAKWGVPDEFTTDVFWNYKELNAARGS